MKVSISEYQVERCKICGLRFYFSSLFIIVRFKENSGWDITFTTWIIKHGLASLVNDHFTKRTEMFLCTKAGIKKIVLLLSLDPGFTSSVGRSGFFYFGEAQSCSQGLTAFWYKLLRKELTIVIIVSDKAQVNQHKEGIQYNYKFFLISNQVAMGLTLKLFKS